MNSLFLILVLVCLVALIVGLVKPQKVIRWGDMEKRNRKSVLKYYGVGLIVFFVLFGVTSNNTGNTNKNDSASQSTTVSNKKELTAEEKAAEEKKAAEKKVADEKAAAEKAAADKAAAEKKAAEEKAAAEKAAAEKAAKEEAERIGYDTGISYEQLARTPDQFKGKKAKFTGRVVQVMEGSGETQLRIAVDDNYKTVLYVAYKSNITSTRVLENDNVTVRGISSGVITYKSTMGGNITIPGMLVEKIDINK